MTRRFGSVGSLLQCFRVRIRVQIFRPDSGSVRAPPLLQLFVHPLIITNSLTSYVPVFIRKSILNSSLPWSKSAENHPWYDSYAFQPATVLPNISSFWCLKLRYVFWFSLLFPILFTWRCSDLLYSEFLLSFYF